MKTKTPMKGLLIFSFYAAKGNVALLFLVCIVFGGVFLATGWMFLFNMLVIYSMALFPMLVIMSMGQNANWERFQLTMPIGRSTLLRMQYLSVILATIVPTLLVTAVTALGVLFQEAMFDGGFGAAMIAIVPSLAMPFFIAGTSLPLAVSKIGRGREGMVLNVCFFAAIGLMMFAPQLAERFTLSLEQLAVWVVAISMFLFIAAYPITRRFYAKVDF